MLAGGYRVQARLEGLFDPPSTISGYRPDIIAQLGGQTVIIEVVKGGVDWPKIEALKRYASENPGQEFRVVQGELK